MATSKKAAGKRRRATSVRAKKKVAARAALHGLGAGFDCDRPGASMGVHYRSFVEADGLIAAGLPVTAMSRLQQTSGLSLQRLKEAAGISEGSFARRKASGRLSRGESERLLRLSRLFEKATALYGGDAVGARQWLDARIPALGDRSPLELARTEPGAREVEDLITRIEHGVVS